MKTPICPVCNKKLHYRDLWRCRKYDVGQCSACGAYYGVRYPGLAVAVVCAAVVLFVLLCLLLQDDFLAASPVLVILYAAAYFLLPFVMETSKKIPQHEQDAKFARREQKKDAADVKIYTAPRKNTQAAVRGPREEEKTIVIGRAPAGRPLTAEERSLKTASYPSSQARQEYGERLRQTNSGHIRQREDQRISSRSISQEERDFFDHYGGSSH